MPGKVSSNVSKARYDVDNTSWEASFLNELGHSQGRKRGLLSCFHDDSASSSKSWGELPGLHEQWEVPRDNLSDYSDRFSSSREVERSIHGDSVASDLIDPSSIVSIASMSEGEICSLCDLNWLTIIDGLNSSKFTRMFLNKISQSEQASGSIGGIHSRPGTILESLSCSTHSNVNILSGTSLEASQY